MHPFLDGGVGPKLGLDQGAHGVQIPGDGGGGQFPGGLGQGADDPVGGEEVGGHGVDQPDQRGADHGVGHQGGHGVADLCAHGVAQIPPA